MHECLHEENVFFYVQLLCKFFAVNSRNLPCMYTWMVSAYHITSLRHRAGTLISHLHPSELHFNISDWVVRGPLRWVLGSHSAHNDHKFQGGENREENGKKAYFKICTGNKLVCCVQFLSTKFAFVHMSVNRSLVSNKASKLKLCIVICESGADR